MGKSWAKTGKVFPVSATAAIDGSIRALIARHFRPRRGAEKQLARAADSTPRAARNWLNESCSPQSAHLVQLMANCHELRADILRLIEDLECRER